MDNETQISSVSPMSEEPEAQPDTWAGKTDQDNRDEPASSQCHRLLRKTRGQPFGRLGKVSLMAIPVANGEEDPSTLGKPMLTPEEGLFVTRFRDIGNVAVLAIRSYVLTGDLRLVRAIYDQVCLGIRPR